ncbi:unnamed protein product, partial [Allacma fusca]
LRFYFWGSGSVSNGSL